MEETTMTRSARYTCAGDALSYARRCGDHDDVEGETMALKHAVELVLDLLEVKVLNVDSARLAEICDAGDQDAQAPGPLQTATFRQDPGEVGWEMPVRTGLVTPSQGTGEIGDNPNRVKPVKRFRLLRNGETGWEAFADGTAADLARKANVRASAIYKNAKTGNAFGNGTWKVKAL